MKTLILLLSTACVCNATFLSLLGGARGGSGGHSSHGHGQEHSHYHQHDHGHHQRHGFGNSPKIIKVILDQGHNGGYAGSGASYGSMGNGLGGHVQIFKVISENAADHGYSAGALSHSSYGSGYGYGGSSASFSSQLNEILPQIIQLILEDDNGYGGDVSSQLVPHFGHSGKVIIKRTNGKANSYYSGGHVVQKGVLKITRIEGAPNNDFSSHSSPSHRHPPHGHGW